MIYRMDLAAANTEIAWSPEDNTEIRETVCQISQTPSTAADIETDENGWMDGWIVVKMGTNSCVSEAQSHIRENWGWGKPHFCIFSCYSVNIWVGSGRAAAPSQLLYNRLAFRRSSRLTGYWRRMECWPQGPVSLLSSGGGGNGGLLNDTTGTLQFLQHSSVDCLNKKKNSIKGGKTQEWHTRAWGIWKLWPKLWPIQRKPVWDLCSCLHVVLREYSFSLWLAVNIMRPSAP